MPAPGPMAPLTVDPLRKFAEHRFVAGLIVPPRYFRVCVMAEHALVADLPSEPGIVCRVVTGIHPPTAAVFGIPGEREFHERVARCPAQIGTDVIARSHHIGNFL